MVAALLLSSSADLGRLCPVGAFPPDTLTRLADALRERGDRFEMAPAETAGAAERFEGAPLETLRAERPDVVLLAPLRAAVASGAFAAFRTLSPAPAVALGLPPEAAPDADPAARYLRRDERARLAAAANVARRGGTRVALADPVSPATLADALARLAARVEEPISPAAERRIFLYGDQTFLDQSGRAIQDGLEARARDLGYLPRVVRRAAWNAWTLHLEGGSPLHPELVVWNRPEEVPDAVALCVRRGDLDVLADLLPRARKENPRAVVLLLAMPDSAVVGEDGMTTDQRDFLRRAAREGGAVLVDAGEGFDPRATVRSGRLTERALAAVGAKLADAMLPPDR